MAAATDYDAPRRNQEQETADGSLEALGVRRNDAQSGAIDIDEADFVDAVEIPGADMSSLSEDEITVRVVPKQPNEFTCTSCFLVHLRGRLARTTGGLPLCRDCA